MSNELLTAAIGAAGSLVGGLIGAWVGGRMTRAASIAVFEQTAANLEAHELRRLRLFCFVNYMGLRFVLPHGRAHSDWSKLMFELNRVQVLWADDNEIVNVVRDLYDDISKHRNADARLLALSRKLASTISPATSALSDADLRNMFG